MFIDTRLTKTIEFNQLESLFIIFSIQISKHCLGTIITYFWNLKLLPGLTTQLSGSVFGNFT